jgi:hypothetical protein
MSWIRLARSASKAAAAGSFCLTIASLALMLTHPAQAQRAQSWMDAQRLLAECSEPMDSLGYNSCIDYIEGVKDTLNYLREHNGSILRLPCTPPKITLGQIHDVFVRFIQSNPQYYNLDAAPAVYAALISAFPCQ